MEFDQEIRWSTLVFSGWFGWESPIPSLTVTLTPTKDRWDPSSPAVVELPRILVCGVRQMEAMVLLRRALAQPLHEDPIAGHVESWR